MKRTGLLGLLLVFVVALVMGTGCTKYASDEDLQMLEEQRNAALSAEQSLEDCGDETSRLERLKAEKQAELQEARAEKQMVKRQLDEKSSKDAMEFDGEGK
ncbi:hypothetical protein BMS3Bbin04_00196 [bacterium BMS3Bbin04]|nr:hypothetical protein BMS3Bbin04_00196 [bacterium BMS3Bbin04]